MTSEVEVEGVDTDTMRRAYPRKSFPSESVGADASGKSASRISAGLLNSPSGYFSR